MELKIENNKLIIDGKETILTDEQLKELGIEPSPFDIKDGDVVYFIDKYGDIKNFIFNKNYDKNNKLLKSSKICKDEKLMEQKRLHQNLNDLLWKFTIENGWSDELWGVFDKGKFFIEYDCVENDFDINFVTFFKIQGTVYFISEEIAQRALDEIVKPYMEEHPEFVW